MLCKVEALFSWKISNPNFQQSFPCSFSFLFVWFMSTRSLTYLYVLISLESEKQHFMIISVRMSVCMDSILFPRFSLYLWKVFMKICYLKSLLKCCSVFVKSKFKWVFLLIFLIFFITKLVFTVLSTKQGIQSDY